MSSPVSLYAYSAPFLSLVVAWIGIRWLLRWFSDQVLDRPNERSLHQHPIPRTGGLGVVAGLAVSVPWVAPLEWWPLWAGAALLVSVSFLDDLVGLPIMGRFLAHVLAVSIMVTGLLIQELGLAWAVVALLAMVWMTNLYNFMDGMDGLAGGMAVIGFACMAVAAWLGGSERLTLVSLCLVSAAGAFLLYNFHPAQIFLGDAGSTVLGFLAAGIGLIGWQYGIWSLWFPMLVFAPFIVDATVTLARRVLGGEKFWRPHRSHYYQRVVLSGWSHRKTAWAEYGLMGLCGSGALAFQYGSDRTRVIIVGVLGLIFLSLALAVSAMEHRTAGRGVARGHS